MKAMGIVIILCVPHAHTAANILVDESVQRIKLIDFGSAEIIEERTTSHAKTFSGGSCLSIGALSYKPPEVLK